MLFVRGGAYCLEGSGHDLGSVVDGEDNVCDTGSCESLDLVLDHGLVAEFDERLGEGEGLAHRLAAGTVCARRHEEHTNGRRRVPKPPTRMRAGKHVSEV